MEKSLFSLLREEDDLIRTINSSEESICYFLEAKKKDLLEGNTYGADSCDRLIGRYQGNWAESKLNLASVRSEMRDYFAELLK